MSAFHVLMSELFRKRCGTGAGIPGGSSLYPEGRRKAAALVRGRGEQTNPFSSYTVWVGSLTMVR